MTNATMTTRIKAYTCCLEFVVMCIVCWLLFVVYGLLFVLVVDVVGCISIFKTCPKVADFAQSEVGVIGDEWAP
jgi:uncharacterized membrane protein YbaN (DUF454 family)